MDTWGLDAVATAEHVRAGRLTSVEAVGQALARIDALDGRLHAFVLVLRQRAMATARQRDVELQAGTVRGPLHGVPVAVKDLFDVAGTRTGAGSLALPNHRAEATAHAVARLEAAGAVVVGKTHTVEFAFGGWGTNPVLGAPWNPHDLACHRAPGGSSSGSAVAVAGGMVPLAIGTDTGGSIRIPAAFCGLFGHKSSLGLIGRSGTRYLSPSHDSVGALACSVRDLRVALEVMAGPDPEDPAPPVALADADVGSVGPLRLATLDDAALDLLEPEVAAQLEESLAHLASTHGAIARLRLPAAMSEMAMKAGRLMSAESYASLHELTESPENRIALEIRERINLGRSVSAAELVGLLAAKRAWKQAFAEAFASYDVLVMPGAPLLPPPIDAIDQSNMALSVFGRFVNMLDLCATSVPVGRSRDGLPIGLQLIARSGADRLALQLAAAMEQDRTARFEAPALPTPLPLLV